MESDLSRDTVKRSEHFSGVLEQQGRVTLDADFNEQTPTPSFGHHSGFEIGIGGDRRDLTIARGRISVDGLLVENDADTTLTTQPFLSRNPADLASAGVTGPGLYGVYLDAWERLVSAIDDPSVRDTALGGPDASSRSRIVWLVKLRVIDATEFGDNPSCARIVDLWSPKCAARRPTSEAPSGTQHHYAKLAIVAYDGTIFALPRRRTATATTT
ncbi:MAG: DUF6519 domain-containing protein [Candidatus Eremiobacteraeota bacterium]|nr:DUF6519 domain-containing protein [Candidatus Eremiobacteraeota bacterium]